MGFLLLIFILAFAVQARFAVSFLEWLATYFSVLVLGAVIAAIAWTISIAVVVYSQEQLNRVFVF